MIEFQYLKFNQRLVFTAITMFIFFWIWPLRLIVKHNNCYFYTLENLIRYGGKVKWYKDSFWNGYHCTWIHKGIEYSYDMTKAQRVKLAKAPWYTIPIFYEGRIRQRRLNSETKTFAARNKKES